MVCTLTTRTQWWLPFFCVSQLNFAKRQIRVNQKGPSATADPKLSVRNLSLQVVTGWLSQESGPGLHSLWSPVSSTVKAMGILHDSVGPSPTSLDSEVSRC